MGLMESDETSKFKYVVDICDRNKTFKSFRLCKKCNNIKPPRTHHCSVCGKCVMRMDHHCPWTGNCVGVMNHKYFICFTFWTIIACLQVYLTTAYIGVATSASCRMKDRRPCYGFFAPRTAAGLALGVAIGVTILLCVHLYLINTNATSLEAADLSHDNPYRLAKASDNNSQILGRSIINKLNPFSVPKEFYKGKKNELYLDGLVYPLRS